MTIYELSLEYEQTSADLRRRIVELEQAGRAAEDEQVKHQMECRARPLRSMYRDVREIARSLEHYYDRQPPKKTAGVKQGKGGRSNAHIFV